MSDRVSKTALALEFGAGAIVGDTLIAGAAKEMYGHLELGHSLVVFNEPYASIAQATMIMCGTSPNDLATGHRVHHHDEFVAAGNSPDDGVDFALHELIGAELEDVPAHKLLIPNLPLHMDRLVRMGEDGRLVHRTKWRSEDAVATNLVTRAIPAANAFGLIVATNKKLGRSHPVERSAAYFAGLGAGTVARPMTTIYTEGVLGLERGNFLAPKTKVMQKLLAGIIERHEDHHDHVDDPLGGMPWRRRVLFHAMIDAGIMRLNTPDLYVDGELA